ncbi:MAG: HK97 gp10 family phage protein [Lachnospiraceae bacterium]|jgi:hypothetical protein|nr:HK97 gp10 family phage protein [Lachnospiraceae bacterium]
MTGLDFSDLDAFIRDLSEIAELPDETAGELLQAQAEIVVEAQKRSAAAHGLVDSGQLQESIRADKKMKAKSGTRYVEVYPRGKRKKRTRYRMSKGDREAGKSRAVTNSEVAFIHEYGAPGKHIKAKQWIKKANEGAADQALEAAAAVYNQYLKNKNL